MYDGNNIIVLVWGQGFSTIPLVISRTDHNLGLMLNVDWFQPNACRYHIVLSYYYYVHMCNLHGHCQGAKNRHKKITIQMRQSHISPILLDFKYCTYNIMYMCT